MADTKTLILKCYDTTNDCHPVDTLPIGYLAITLDQESIPTLYDWLNQANQFTIHHRWAISIDVEVPSALRISYLRELPTLAAQLTDLDWLKTEQPGPPELPAPVPMSHRKATTFNSLVQLSCTVEVTDGRHTHLYTTAFPLSALTTLTQPASETRTSS